jgi:hypothetical protein
MPVSTETYRVFISSPSDVAEDRQTAKGAVLSASRLLAAKGIRLEPWLWEEDTTSEFGRPPQDVISGQLGGYDFYIGLMGSNFGSPTAHFGSGTEQEFYEALQSYEAGKIKKIGFFFKKVQIDTSALSTTHIMQLQKVTTFREKIRDLGLYKPFESAQVLTAQVTEFLVTAFDPDLKPKQSNPLSPGGPSVADEHSPISPSFYRDVLNAVDKDIASDIIGCKLDDLFVELSMKASLTNETGKISVISYDAKAIAKSVTEGRCFQICGEETAGKTTICGRIFIRLHEAGFYPVLIQGGKIRAANRDRFRNMVTVQLAQQYENLSQEQARRLPNSKIVVVLDDFDIVGLNASLSLDLLSYIQETYHACVISTSISYNFAIYEKTDSVSILSRFVRAEIQEMGQRQRYEIIEKWYGVRSPSAENKDKLLFKIDQTRIEINRILITHIVPRTPLIILILLQAIDCGQVADLSQSGYVRYYKFLIDNTILRNLRIDEAEHAYALLPELAWAAYNSSNRELCPGLAEQVVERFAERRALRKATLFRVLEDLRAIGMFDRVSANYRFRHDYAYYFFLADYMNQRLQYEEMRKLVLSLCHESRSREVTNILVFLSFHSDSTVIMDSLVTQLEGSYKGVSALDFSGAQTETINRLLVVAPRQVVDHDMAKEGREMRLEAEDASDEAQDNLSVANSQMGEMESVFSAVEVLGHILRNHYARLDAHPKARIFEAATGAILRCAGNFINGLIERCDFLINIVSNSLSILDDKSRDEERITIARTVIFLIAFGFLYHCCK